MLSLEIVPIAETEREISSFIIAFEATPTDAPKAAPATADDAQRLRNAQLEKELVANKEYLQSVIDEREVAN
jgi:hypothetical protein